MDLTVATVLLASTAKTHGWHGGWWIGPLFPVLWLALIGVALWLVIRRRTKEPTALQQARDVLAERYARGELSTEEYRERFETLS